MNLLHVTNREDWRAWLAGHHATETEVWLVFAKQQAQGRTQPGSSSSRARRVLGGSRSASK